MQFPLGNIYERVRVCVCVLYILIRKKVTTSDYVTTNASTVSGRPFFVVTSQNSK